MSMTPPADSGPDRTLPGLAPGTEPNLPVVRPVAPTIVTDSPRRELLIGLVVIGLFFVIFLGWAAFARLDAGAFAQGQVAVSGNRQSVQNLQGGTVATLHVAEGDRVTKGQILVELRTGELKASERGVTSQVMALLAQRSRMVAERDGLATIPAPPEYTDLSPDDRVLANEAMQLQARQYQARRSGRTTETGVLGQRVTQLNEQIGGFERQIESNIEQRRLIGEELEGLRSLAAQGFAPQNRVRALERTAAALDGELGSLRAQVARTRATVGETQLQMLSVGTRLNEDVAEQLRQTEVELNQLMPRMTELRSQIANARIRSPATGQVVALSAFTEGGVIQPGETIMDIVPEAANQVIIASVNPTDIDNLRAGQTTEVKFPGLREFNPPILRGEVTRISADSFTNEQNGQSFYRAEIVVPPAELAKLGRSADRIRPGMPVEVVVILRKRTALQYLIEPLTNNLWRSGSTQ